MQSQEPLQLKVKKLHPEAKLPQRATAGATGFDLYACIERQGVLALGMQPTLVGTGIAIEVPSGCDAQIRPRSGLASRGIGVIFGTIDSDYRGEVLVTMYLLAPGSEFEVKHGDRIAQLVITRLADLTLVEVQALSATQRGDQGHGSTGL